MSIAWMTFFTPTVDPDRLRTRNEQSAATVYARWGAAHRWTADLIQRRRDARRARLLDRALYREFGRSPDHLLGDLGLWRGGDGTLGFEPRLSAATASLPWKTNLGQRPVIERDTTVTTLVIPRAPGREEESGCRDRAA